MGTDATPTATRDLVLSLAFAVVAPVAVALALVTVRDDIRTSNVSLVLVVVVVVAAMLGGRLGGAVAALSSVLAFDLLFTRPYGSLTIARGDDVETAVLLLVVGLAVGELVVRARRSHREARESRAEVVRVRRLSELAAGGEPAGRLIGIVQGELSSLLQLEGCRFERPPFCADLPELTHQGVRNAAPVPPAAAPVAAGAVPDTDAGIGTVALPVFGGGRAIGRYLLDLPEGSTGILLASEDRALAMALADQLGTVLSAAVDD